MHNFNTYNNSFNNKNNDNNKLGGTNTNNMINKGNNSITNNNINNSRINNKMNLHVNKNEKGSGLNTNNEITKMDEIKSKDAKPYEDINISYTNETQKKIEPKNNCENTENSTNIKQDITSKNNDSINVTKKEDIKLLKEPIKKTNVSLNNDKNRLLNEDNNNEIKQEDNKIDKNKRLTQNIKDKEGFFFFFFFFFFFLTI